ncbi:MAG: hypothetical protein CMO55_14555 [Verrucomicrobiales bacterium]|nr:hypothetical protein [Verrucomicrobiales bacterium]
MLTYLAKLSGFLSLSLGGVWLADVLDLESWRWMLCMIPAVAFGMWAFESRMFSLWRLGLLFSLFWVVCSVMENRMGQAPESFEVLFVYMLVWYFVLWVFPVDEEKAAEG